MKLFLMKVIGKIWTPAKDFFQDAKKLSILGVSLFGHHKSGIFIKIQRKKDYFIPAELCPTKQKSCGKIRAKFDKTMHFLTLLLDPLDAQMPLDHLGNIVLQKPSKKKL